MSQKKKMKVVIADTRLREEVEQLREVVLALSKRLLRVEFKLKMVTSNPTVVDVQ